MSHDTYNSESKGPTKIADMHSAHLANAIKKLEAREASTGNVLTPDEVATLTAMRERANAQTYDATDE